MAKLKSILILFFFSLASACGQSTPAPIPTAILLPTDTPSPTETPPPTLTSTPTEVPLTPKGPQTGTTLLYMDGSTLVYIQTGEFEMGGGGKNNPIHTVSLRSYWIQKTEVTRRMYSLCLAAGKCTPVTETGVSGFVTDTAYYDRPVVGIKYEQAQSYCSWMGGRLPTEAEWEYSARGTTGGDYPWGSDEPTCDLTNFNDCIGRVTRATIYQTDKSPFGVLDMAGNVREWVSDYFDGNYYKNSPSQNPTGPIKGNYYVVRGGGYGSPNEEVTTYFRGFLKSDGYEEDLGFRCVVDNPVVYAPYCEASQYTQEIQSVQPADRCEPGVSQLTKERGFSSGYGVLGTATGGKIVSVAPVNLNSFDCEETDAQNFKCTLTQKGLRCNSGYPITVCVTCSASSSFDIPSVECPLNYKKVEGQDYCEYAGGAVPDYCPPNSVPLNENQCVYQQATAGTCPMGSYFDGGMNACVTIGQTPLKCPDGFGYDFDQSCCTARGINVEYPGCRRDEYYSSEYGCAPLPNPDGVESCATSLLYLCR